jgi:hypothetical protein
VFPVRYGHCLSYARTMDMSRIVIIIYHFLKPIDLDVTLITKNAIFWDVTPCGSCKN